MHSSTTGGTLLPDALVTSEFLPVGLLPQIASEFGISAGQAGLMVTTLGFTAAVLRRWPGFLPASWTAATCYGL